MRILFVSLLICSLTLPAFSSVTVLTNLLGTQSNFSCDDLTISNISDICNLANLPNSFNFSAFIESAQNLDFLLNTTLPFFNGSVFIQEYLPPQLQSLASNVKLDQLFINQPYVYINIGNNDALRFSGNVSFMNIANVFVDVAFMRSNPVSAFFIVNLPFSSINALLSSFIPIDFSNFFDIFSNNSNFTLCATNGFDFTQIPELKPLYLVNTNIWYGPFFGITANMMISQNDNNVSNFLRQYLGQDTEYQFSMSVDTSGFNGFLGLSPLQISQNLTLTNLGVTVTVQSLSPEPQISFAGQMNLVIYNNPFILDGSVTFTPLGVDLSFSSFAIWNNAFGLNRLSFGNLTLGGGISYTGTPTEFTAGGMIAYGLNCFVNQTFVGDGYCLYANGSVGIDVTNPANNYFSGEVSKVDLDIVLRALLGSQTLQNVIVPQVVSDSLVFPQGLITTYSLVTNTVKGGYFLEGSAQIFNASATISIQLDAVMQTLKAYMQVSPINFGNVFTFIGASSQLGPFINISAALFPPALSFQISAIVTVLGVTQPVIVNFDLARMFFPITGALQNGVLITNLFVQLTYANFMSFNFNVTGNVNIDQNMFNLIQNITANITTTLNNAKAAVSQAQNNVSLAQAALNATASSLCGNIETKCQKKLCSNIFCTFVGWVIDNSCALACNATEVAFSAASGVLSLTQKTLNLTQTTLGGLSKAAVYVSTNAVTVFNIVGAGFSIIINESNMNSFSAGISVNVNMTVLGTIYQTTMVWVFNDIESIKSALVTEATSIINGQFA